MQITRISFLLLFLFFSITCRGAESEQIIVRLATESPLMPLYLTKTSATENSSYLQQLDETLRFDLNVNGMTRVVKVSSDNDALCANGSLQTADKVAAWKAQNLYFIVKPCVKDQKLSAQVLALNNQTLKTINDIPLTGDIKQDRKSVHLLADAIYKALFGVEGIASTHILYTVKHKVANDKWEAEVWECDYDGANAHQITNEKALCVTPIHIPPKDGFTSSNFFFVSYKNGQPKIFISSSKSGANTNRRLTTLRGNQLMPTISKQRDKVAFISDVTGNPDLFLQDFSLEVGALGKPRQIFAAPHATQGSPTFNPEGNRIAFVSNKDSIPRIYVMDIPSPETKNIKDIRANLITKQNRECTAPCWSPDGKKIAYSAMTNGTRQIWIYDFNTREERQITQGQGHKENPSWAPDSLHIVFNSSTRNGNELFLINLNQAEAFQITSGKGEKRFPSWEKK